MLQYIAIRFRAGLFTNTVVGPLIDVSAYSFAPQSLVAPFGGRRTADPGGRVEEGGVFFCVFSLFCWSCGGLDVVWNALLAPFILKEKLTRPVAVIVGSVKVSRYSRMRASNMSVSKFRAFSSDVGCCWFSRLPCSCLVVLSGFIPLCSSYSCP